ncbi:thermonuclease family protein [Candidatus Gracilibacteria bacterium]|nr:thermonuclease family protein [Candidatus Gracilibacteria bacterium]
MNDKEKKMFGNRLLKILIFVMILSLQNTVFSKNAWTTRTVDRVLEDGRLVFNNGKVSFLEGMQFPERKKNDPGYCHARTSWRVLKLLLEGHSVRVQIHDDALKNNIPISLKKEKADIVEFLLEKGLARFVDSDRISTPQRKKYQLLEQEARFFQKGLWQGCETQLSLQKWGRSQVEYQRKYAPFFAPLSVGIVDQVLAGNVLKLKNGIIIRLLGIQVPSPNDQRQGFRCFGEQARNYLESLLLGKTVYLRKDFSQLDERKRLLRYVFGDIREKISINETLIRDGYAKSFWEGKDELYKKQFEHSQEQSYSNLNGAWKNCSSFIFHEFEAKKLNK